MKRENITRDPPLKACMLRNLARLLLPDPESHLQLRWRSTPPLQLPPAIVFFSFFVKSSIFNIEMISLHAGCLLLVVGTAQALSLPEPPPPPPPSVSDYNVVFDVPSDNGTYQHCFALIVSTNFTLNLFMHCTCSLKPSY